MPIIAHVPVVLVGACDVTASAEVVTGRVFESNDESLVVDVIRC